MTALLSGRRLISPDQLLAIVDFRSVDELDSPLSTSTDYQHLENLWIIAFSRHLRGT
jgi:hypothetical protein